MARHGLTGDAWSTRQIYARSLATHNDSAGAAQGQADSLGIHWAHSVLTNPKSTTRSRLHKDVADRPGPAVRPVAEIGIRRDALPEYIYIILSSNYSSVSISSHSSQRGILQLSESVADQSLVAVADDRVSVRWIPVRATEHGEDDSEGSRHYANGIHGIDRDHARYRLKKAHFSTVCQ